MTTQTFLDLGVPARLVASLAERGIIEPTPIQAATLPDALAGHDVCGRAPTGSGKTLAFGLALALRAEQGASRHPSAMVLVPTRELASQVQRELALVWQSSPRRVLAIYGGVGYGGQQASLSRGVDVVVATPGRALDLVERRALDLSSVGLVVVDEADRMADMGFLPAVRKLVDATAPARQTLLYSATLDGEVDALVRRYQRSPRRHEVVVPEADQGEVAHLYCEAERPQRVGLTAGLIAAHGRTIVFCRTRHGVDRVTRQLGQLGVAAVPIHGSRSQAQRERALSAFSAGGADALVATDVAARGIHVDDVACVVHFDLATDAKDYVHRSGRTGRAGADGVVVSLVASAERTGLRALERGLGLRIERTGDPAGGAAGQVATVGVRPGGAPTTPAGRPVRPQPVGGEPASGNAPRPAVAGTPSRRLSRSGRPGGSAGAGRRGRSGRP
jgi:superfamily II DNA/RNA helicase